MRKPERVINCSQLAEHFTSHILEKYGSMDKVRVTFDRYDVQHSLKQSTRDRRLGSQTAVIYHITDSTNIFKIPIIVDTALSCGYEGADRILRRQYVAVSPCFRTICRCGMGTQCGATHTNKIYLNSDHEEADTKLNWCHGLWWNKHQD